MTGFVYLASPYSHADAKIQEQRFDAVVREAAQMMKEDHKVFSPISHTHHIGLVAPWIDHDGWLEQDIAILRHAAALVVLMLPGWRESKGVKREIDFARNAGIPIRFRDANGTTGTWPAGYPRPPGKSALADCISDW